MRIFLSIWKAFHGTPTYSNAHAKVKRCIFDFQFPGNRFEFGIIEIDCSSSTIWAIRIRVSFAGFKMLKFPEFSLKMHYFKLLRQKVFQPFSWVWNRFNISKWTEFDLRSLRNRILKGLNLPLELEFAELWYNNFRR